MPVISAMFFVTWVSAALCVKSTLLPPMPATLVQPVESGLHTTAGSESRAPWSLFWDGIDILDADDLDDNTRRFGALAQAHEYVAELRRNPVPGSPRVGVEVMGIQDTGTNLLAALLYANFGGQIVHFDSTANAEKKGVWKHAHMGWIDGNVPRAFDNLRAHKVVPLVMVRNPLSWLQAIKEAPYELAACVAGGDWLQKPCIHQYPAGYVQGEYGYYGRAVLENVLGVWGRWTQSYNASLSKYFDKVIFLKYEDLVLDTEKTLRKIAAELGVMLPEKVDIIEGALENRGAAIGHAAAVQKILNKEHLLEFSDKELRIACNELQSFAEIVDKLGYRDCIDAQSTTSTGWLGV